MKILQDEIKRLKEELEFSKKMQIESTKDNNNINNYNFPTNFFLDKNKENLILENTNEIKILIKKIEGLFALSPQLEAKLKIFDDIYMDDFYQKKEKYLKNFDDSMTN